MAGLELTYLSGPDVDRLGMSADDILDPVADVLAAMGRGETVIEPRVHLFPGGDADGHFNVLRGALPRDRLAGVKVVGDYVGNGERGLPSELALLLLFDAATGAPQAIVDATAITAMRTGAVTAIGARHLARRSSRVLGHIGSRGTAEWNVRLLRHVLPELREVRIHSRTPESRAGLAARLDAEPYGTVSAVDLDLTDVMDKVVVDDWRQAQAGPLGALRAHVDSGRLNEQTLHAELGQIVCGERPGRESDAERILLWHRGLSLTDIALGRAMLARAGERVLGVRLPFHDA